MSKSALLFLGIYGIALIASFIFPPAGVWGYIYEWYNHPIFHWWGKDLAVFGNRWSFYIGFAMVAGLILHYRNYSQINFIRHPQTKFILFYTLNAFIVSLLWAYSYDLSYAVAIEHLKMFFLYWCIVKTHSNKKIILIPIVISIVGCINWGIDLTFINIPSGRNIALGGPNAYGGNFIAPHVIAFLPLAGLLIVSEKKWLKCICLMGIPFIVNIVAFSESRGAFLAIIVAGLSGVIFTKTKLKKLTILALIIGCVLGFRLFPSQFMNRQRTIVTYEDDSSAMGRIYAWQAAWRLIKKNPFGYGGEGFDNGLGAPLMPLGFHTTHNMFFEIFVAWGVQGIIAMFGFILITLIDSFRLYKFYWDFVSWPPPRESMIALGILCGLCSMFVSSMFLNRYRWELWWVFGGLIVCLKNIAIQEMESAEN